MDNAYEEVKTPDVAAKDPDFSDTRTVKYTVKDSVFSDLFKIPKYLLQMYQTLHPEDTETTVSDFTNVTIHNITDGRKAAVGSPKGRAEQAKV